MLSLYIVSFPAEAIDIVDHGGACKTWFVASKWFETRRNETNLKDIWDNG